MHGPIISDDRNQWDFERVQMGLVDWRRLLCMYLPQSLMQCIRTALNYGAGRVFRATGCSVLRREVKDIMFIKFRVPIRRRNAATAATLNGLNAPCRSEWKIHNLDRMSEQRPVETQGPVGAAVWHGF